MKYALLVITFIFLFSISYAYSNKAECYAAAQERFDEWEAEANSMASSNQYTITGTCPVNSGRMEPCTGDYPGVNYCACQLFRCENSGGGTSCFSQLQQCCLANAKYDNAKELARLQAECDAQFPGGTTTTDECAGVTCGKICINGKIYSRECYSGSCVIDEYTSPTTCQYGCETGTAVCSPKPTDYCADFYSRFDKESCYGSTHYYDCVCDPSNGEPRCKLEECSNGCDSQGVKCKSANKCAKVECPGACINDVYYYEGVCDNSDGSCVYSKQFPCPNGCDSQSNYCKGSVSGRVYFIDHPFGQAQGIETPIRNVLITISTSNGPANVWTDEEGVFSYDGNELVPGTKVNSIIMTFTEKNSKLSLPQSSQSNLDKTTLLFSGSVDVSDPSLTNMDFQLSNLGDSAWGERELENAIVYSNTLKSIEFKEKVLGLSSVSSQSEKVYTHDGGITSHCPHYYSYCTGSVKTYPGITINSVDMGAYSADAPLNREFHEYCHHIQSEFFENRNSPKGYDHGGYSNPTSQWGLIEGWAEFCALEMKKYYGLGSRHLYDVGSTTWNVELNYKMDNPKMPQLSEEIAIAGILLDLRDSPSDYNGVDDDFISMPLSDIYRIISSKYNFNDGKGSRYIETVYDLYFAFNSSTNNRAVMKDIDQIFVLHGAFQDSNSNNVYDSGEQIGYSGKGGQPRKDLYHEPGTEVLINAVDSNGNSLNEGVVAVVSVDFSGKNSYLSYSFEKSVVNGMVAVPIPPEEYDATIIINAKQAGGEQVSSTYLEITTKTIYDSIEPSKPLSIYSPIIELQEISCESNSQCLMWGYGDTCSNNKCIITSDGVTNSNDACCSGFILLFSLLFLSYLSVRH